MTGYGKTSNEAIRDLAFKLDEWAEGTQLTPLECRALRLASIFGTPDPTPPEIESAIAKLRRIEEH